jgi:hypothetical protein
MIGTDSPTSGFNQNAPNRIVELCVFPCESRYRNRYLLERRIPRRLARVVGLSTAVQVAVARTPLRVAERLLLNEMQNRTSTATKETMRNMGFFIFDLIICLRKCLATDRWPGDLLCAAGPSLPDESGMDDRLA